MQSNQECKSLDNRDFGYMGGWLCFKCDRCGLCCQNLGKSPLYADLDDGTGVCRFLDRKSNLCKIYENRPVKCNVEKSYAFFADAMSYDEYLKLNHEACLMLKGRN